MSKMRGRENAEGFITTKLASADRRLSREEQSVFRTSIRNARPGIKAILSAYKLFLKQGNDLHDEGLRVDSTSSRSNL